MKLFSDYFKLLAVAAVFCAASCKQVEAPLIPVQSVTIGQADQTLTVGETVILSATVLPEDTDYKTVLWTSSDEEVVMVSSDAHARAIGAGTAQVTAEAGGKSASITITVNAAPISPEPEPEVSPAVLDSAVTVGADHISPVSAVLNGQAILAYATPEISAGFQYAESPAELPFSATTLEAVIADANYNFSLGVSSLDPGKTYCYRSVIQVEGREHYGETLTFTTNDIGSILVTKAAPEEDLKPKGATLRGSVDLTDVLYDEISYGFIWGESETTLDHTVAADGASGTEFWGTVKGLSYRTKYWYKAYVVIDGRKYYANIADFTTVDIPGVDLGLSVRWASMNVGAGEPEEYGDYYAWGEVEPYYVPGTGLFDPPVWKYGKTEGYDYPSYKWTKQIDDILYYLKYCPVEFAGRWGGVGEPDGKTVLDPEDDVAHIVLGGAWRMPTREECQELTTQCTWEKARRGTVHGLLVTGPNGNSIFLPAAGHRRDIILEGLNEDCFMWSSSRGLSNNGDYFGPWCYYFDYHEHPNMMLWPFANGFTIRAVIE